MYKFYFRLHNQVRQQSNPGQERQIFSAILRSGEGALLIRPNDTCYIIQVMPVYIALLRGINVSGQKKIPMAALRKLLASMNFDNVQTYIQSGNVVFTSQNRATARLEQEISDAIRSDFGFVVPVLVKERSDFKAILDSNPYSEEKETAPGSLYFVFLDSTPPKERVAALQQEKFDHEVCTITENCVYLLCYKGAGKAKLNNNLIEQRLGVVATTRNNRTVMNLLSMSDPE